MKRESCIKELNDVLNFAERHGYLWEKNPNLQIKVYPILSDKNEDARISLIKNGRFGFKLGGIFFNPYTDKEKENLNAEETWVLAYEFFDSKRLREGNLIRNFREAIKVPLGGYFASRAFGL